MINRINIKSILREAIDAPMMDVQFCRERGNFIKLRFIVYG